ncbi:hypothetical protein AAE478_006724 [Parahypoxylon ruwenzoriense]
MTSLDFIMDMVDEEDTPQVNKNDGASANPGSSRSHDPSRAATSSHEKPKDQDDRLASASTRRRGPSSRSSKSTTTASPSSSSAATATAPSSARPAPVSRRSTTTSSESMDPSGYGSHAQGSSSGRGMSPSNMPTRPMGNALGEGNVPVKLTPITGRVSRAKKGMPVHTCEICKPPKTFTRAEHLRRHQLSHGTPQYPCNYPGCDKIFHRHDLLARHAQRHDQDTSSRGTGGGDSRPPSAPLEEGGLGLSYHNPSSIVGGSSSRVVMPGPSDISSSTSYSGNISSYQPMGNQGGGSRQAPMSPPQHSSRRESYQSNSSAPSQGHSYVLSSHTQMPLLGNQPSSIGGSPVTGTTFGLNFEPRTSSPYPLFMDAEVPQSLPSLTIPDNNFPPGLLPAGHDGSPWPSSASESTYSTTPSEVSHTHRRTIARGYESPTSDWPGPGLYSSGAPQSLHSPDGGLETMATSVAPFFANPFASAQQHFDQALGLSIPFSEDQSFIEQAQPYHPYSSVRSPTPPTISLAAQPTENLVTLAAPSISDAASTGGRQKGSAVFLGSLQGAALLTANTLAPQVRGAIPKYLDVYWKRFDALYPLVHRKSVKSAAGELLRCAMAAVGTQFLRGKEDRNIGKELHEFAWKEVNLCAQWDLQVMQTILLCEFYARFRGRSVQRGPSGPFQWLYSRMADPSTPDNPLHNASTRDERWNEWIDTESRRRLLAACFVLDVHTSVYYEQHSMKQFPISIPHIPLIRNTEDLWAARSPEEWEALTTRPTNPEPTSLSGEPLAAEQIAEAPPFDHAVFLTWEALRLPKRSNPSILDPSKEVDEASAERISKLFPGSAVGNTYLALHYTPLHDLLAVSGDTWLFSKKVVSDQVFQEHKRRLQAWCSSSHAATAAGFASKALLAFLDHDNYSNRNSLNTAVSPSDLENGEEEEDGQNQGQGQDRDKSWNMSDISDYWAMYVCALICWALGHRAIVRGAGSTGSGPNSDSASHQHHHNNHQHQHHHSNVNAGEKGERETIKWLRTAAGLSAEKLLHVRARREIMGVVGMVRRRLEDEAVGGKNRLLVDAMGTLRKLEERANDKWF